MLRLQRLESRDCPAVDLGDGVIGFGRFQVRPFEDWHGGCNLMEVEGKVWVGPQPGGGPRVAVFDALTGDRDRGDWFAGDSRDRSGIVFVDTGRTVTADPIPAITVGSGFPVYVDFHGLASRSQDYVQESMELAGFTLRGLPYSIQLRSNRPSDFPAKYGTVNVGDETSWYGGAAGYAQLGEWNRPAVNEWDERIVYVGPDTDAALTGRRIAHEIGHALGIGHSNDPESVMRLDSGGTRFTEADSAQAKPPV